MVTCRGQVTDFCDSCLRNVEGRGHTTAVSIEVLWVGLLSLLGLSLANFERVATTRMCLRVFPSSVLTCFIYTSRWPPFTLGYYSSVQTPSIVPHGTWPV